MKFSNNDQGPASPARNGKVMGIKKLSGRKVYLNGSLVLEKKACIPVFDRGLLYGDGLFETMKATDGIIAYRSAHMKRLQKGARLLGIPAGPLKDLFADVKAGTLERLIKANGHDTGPAYMRITVTRGYDPKAISSAGLATGAHFRSVAGFTPTILVVTKPMDAKALSKQQKNGIKAVLIKGYCPSIPWIKTLNYLPSILGRAEAARKGASDGIFIDADGYVTEATSANLFIVTRSGLKTAPVYEGTPGKGVLPGIMRGAVINQARRLGIRITEGRIRPAELTGAAEAFLTNSCIEVCPLVAVDGRAIGSGRPGVITRAIQNAFALEM